MTKADLATVLCRFISLYLIVNAFVGTLQLLSVFALPMSLGGVKEFSQRMFLSMFLPHLSSLFMGLVVWRMAPFIGQKMGK